MDKEVSEAVLLTSRALGGGVGEQTVGRSVTYFLTSNLAGVMSQRLAKFTNDRIYFIYGKVRTEAAELFKQ